MRAVSRGVERFAEQPASGRFPLIEFPKGIAFNAACEPVGLVPTRSPEEAGRAGRYVLENDEHVDVLVARSVPIVDDLILTKQIQPRPKDLEDIRLLNALRVEGKT